jgi:hypothetical protein
MRSGSELASNEYFMSVMGLIFLRHAYSRFLGVKPAIEASLPSRGGVKRALTNVKGGVKVDHWGGAKGYQKSER